MDRSIEIVDVNVRRVFEPQERDGDSGATSIWFDVVAARETVRVHEIRHELSQSTLTSRVAKWGGELHAFRLAR